MRTVKLIGLTGQSGAGKTTVLRCWAERGASVFDSDLAVKKIYESGSPCLKAVAAEFGSDILRNDGTLDRALLAQRAFSDPARTQALNELVHPFVTAELLKQIKAERPRILIIDAPQLFESDLDALCDLITAVTADEKLRLSRICVRDGVSEAQARLRLSAQHDEAFFRKNADHVLENNGNTEELLIKAGALYDMICI